MAERLVGSPGGMAGMRVGLAGLLSALLPPSALKNWLLRTLGWEIADTAHLGHSLLLCRHVRLGAASRVGSLNLVKGNASLVLGSGAQLGALNWVSGPHRLTLGREAALTSRHYVDLSADVTFGDFSTVAGYRTTFLTHSVDLRTNRQRAQPITIGAYGFVGTGCVLLGDAHIGDHCVIGAGAVVPRGRYPSWGMFGGNPARKIGTVDAEWLYMQRHSGRVHKER